MSRERTKARRAAVQAIYQWQMTGQDVGEIEEQFLQSQDMTGVDVGYFRELVRQIPLRVHELEDHFIPYADRPVAEIDPVERAILRIAVFELEFRPDIPYRVVINEAVELAKVFGAEHGHKYVNGIVDKTAHKLRAIEIRTRGKQPKTEAERH